MMHLKKTNALFKVDQATKLINLEHVYDTALMGRWLAYRALFGWPGRNPGILSNVILSNDSLQRL